MAFPCPGCGAAVEASLESWGLRCPACRSRLVSRVVEATATQRVYEVEAAGRPQTRARVSQPWTADDSRRLRGWLLWSSTITLGLVAVLYAMARGCAP